MANETTQLVAAVKELSSIIEDYKRLVAENDKLKSDLSYYKKKCEVLEESKKHFDEETDKLIKDRYLSVKGIEGAYEALQCDYKRVCEELHKTDPQNPLGTARRITISDKQIDVIQKLNKRGGLSAAGIGHRVKLSSALVKRIIKCDLEQLQPVYSVDDFIEN